MAAITDEQRERDWEKAKDLLWRIMRHVELEKLEKLTEKIETKSFREGVTYKMFMNSLK
jgi:hypothetical protein